MSSAITRKPRAAKWLDAQQVFEPTSSERLPGPEVRRSQAAAPSSAPGRTSSRRSRSGRLRILLLDPSRRRACTRQSAQDRRPRGQRALGDPASDGQRRGGRGSSEPHDAALERTLARLPLVVLGRATHSGCARADIPGSGETLGRNSGMHELPAYLIWAPGGPGTASVDGSIGAGVAISVRNRSSASILRSATRSRTPWRFRRHRGDRAAPARLSSRTIASVTEVRSGSGIKAVLAVAAKVAVAVGVGAHDRCAGRHRLQRRQAEPLVRRGLDEHGRLVEQSVDLVVARSGDIADAGLPVGEFWLDSEQAQLRPRLRAARARPQA